MMDESNGICKYCSGALIGVEYAWDFPGHYDGVSEWRCGECGIRIGRWSGVELAQGESEERPW
jgi:hypothetical protein